MRISPVSQQAAQSAVANALSTVLQETPGGLLDTRWYLLQNAGGTALSDLQLQFQFSPGGSWVTILSASDWAGIISGATQVPGFLMGVSTTNPATLAGSGSSWFGIRPLGIYGIRLQAQTASGTTTLVISGSGRGVR